MKKIHVTPSQMCSSDMLAELWWEKGGFGGAREGGHKLLECDLKGGNLSKVEGTGGAEGG